MEKTKIKKEGWIILGVVTLFFLVMCNMGSDKNSKDSSSKEQTNESQKRLRVASDPNARYELISLDGSSNKRIIVTSRFSRKTLETTYSSRQVNCDDMTFRYLGSGDTIEQMQKSPADKFMSPLVPGSISSEISLLACKNVGYKTLKDPS